MDVLVRSGAMDGLDPDRNRARMINELPEAVHAAEQYQRDQESGQVDMFGSFSQSDAPHITEHRDVRPWTRLQGLQAERDTLGLYLTGHPVELQANDIARFTTCTLGAVGKRMPAESQGQTARHADDTGRPGPVPSGAVATAAVSSRWRITPGGSRPRCSTTPGRCMPSF